MIFDLWSFSSASNSNGWSSIGRGWSYWNLWEIDQGQTNSRSISTPWRNHWWDYRLIPSRLSIDLGTSKIHVMKDYSKQLFDAGNIAKSVIEESIRKMEKADEKTKMVGRLIFDLCQSTVSRSNIQWKWTNQSRKKCSMCKRTFQCEWCGVSLPFPPSRIPRLPLPRSPSCL